MVVDFSQVILGLDGNSMRAIAPDGKPIGKLTLGKVAVHVLLDRFIDEVNLSGEVMENRFDLAYKIHNCSIEEYGPTLEVSPEEVVLLRKLIPKGHGPLVSTRARRMLNGTTNAPSE